MDLFIGKEQNVGILSGYVKAREFKEIELWYREPLLNSIHYYDTIINDDLYMLWGNLFECPQSNPAELAARTFLEKGEEKLFDLDGEFIFAKIKSGNDITVIQCNYNMPDLFFRKYDSGFTLTSDPQLLFRDFSMSDVDEKSVFDYLACGKMVGGNTFSRKVKSVCRGGKLVICDDKIEITYDHVMHYIPGKEDWDLDVISDELYDTYLNSVYKRAKGKVDESVIFLSGGLDSRILLAAFNEVFEKKITCISFGQPGAGEVYCARQVAKIRENPHIVLELLPSDFTDKASDYIEMTAGMDQFPQSYIFKVISRLEDFNYVFPGSDLTDIFFHAGVHRQYLNEDILEYDGLFSQYLFEHLGNARMQAIEPRILDRIYKDGINYMEGRILEDAKRYDGYKASDIYTGYINNNDAAHSISFRTSYIPGRFKNSIDPSGDKKFTKLLMQLPMWSRMTDELHTRMLKKASPEYLKPIYPNINMSVAFSTKYWEECINIERQRELLYEKAMKEYNDVHVDKVYYTYYYSDFNGYSRYDNNWIEYIDELLLNKDAFIYTKWIDYNVVSNMIFEHRDNRANYRKELILLASLEQFFKSFLKR